MKILDQVKELVSGATVYGEPYVKNGLTVIPASRISGGGGGGQESGADAAAGGGAGVDARPVGAFVVKGDDVSWVPAIDVNRIVLGSQVVAVIALLTVRAIVKARARR